MAVAGVRYGPAKPRISADHCLPNARLGQDACPATSSSWTTGGPRDKLSRHLSLARITYNYEEKSSVQSIKISQRQLPELHWHLNMAEATFAKTFVSSLNSRPIKLSADHVEDPKKFPARPPVRVLADPRTS